MHNKADIGCACGRIHPIGRGIMVWYQKFEYAIAHWFQVCLFDCHVCSFRFRRQLNTSLDAFFVLLGAFLYFEPLLWWTITSCINTQQRLLSLDSLCNMIKERIVGYQHYFWNKFRIISDFQLIVSLGLSDWICSCFWCGNLCTRGFRWVLQPAT